MAPDPCITEAAAAAFVDGTFSPEERATVQAHLGGCESCRRWVSELVRLQSSTDRSAAVSPAAAAAIQELLMLSPGQQLSRYVIEARIGGGGMGVVYAAYDPELDRRVALKVVRAELLEQDARAEERLREEARSMAQLVHPNVVRVYDVGVDQRVLYIAMEYVAGEDLASKAKRLRASGDWRGVLQACLEAGQGLLAAHGQRLVHRDFKPQNVLCASDGRVMVVDFGLTRQLAATAALAPSGKSQAAGTPGYAAPEQAAGLASDERSDQFSYCVTVAECLGELAPPGVRRILARGMAAVPGGRYPSMAELLGELRGVLQARRRNRAFAALALVVLAAVGVAGAGVRTNQMARLRAACARGELRAGAAWSGELETLTRQRFLETKKPNAAEVHARLAADLARYRDRWASSYGRACDATAGELPAAQVRCLESRLTALTQLGALWTRPLEARLVDKANDFVAELPSISDCDDPVGLARGGLAPAPAGQEAPVQELRARLAEISLQAAAGDEAGARARLQALDPPVHALGFAPLGLELQAARAKVLTRGASEEAKPLWREVLAKANALGDDAHAAQAALALYGIAAKDEQLDAARTLEPMVLSAVERARSPALRAELEAAKLGLRFAEGHFQEALELAPAAEAQLSAARAAGALEEPGFSRALARVVIDEARSLYEAGRHVEAQRETERARTLLSRVYPDSHPLMADLSTLRGAILQQAGQPVLSLEAFQEAVDIRKRVYGAEDWAVLASTNNLGQVLRQLGRNAEAAQLLGPALLQARRQLGPEHATTLALARSLATVEIELEHLPQARALLEEVIAARLRKLGPQHPALTVPYNDLGLALLASGELAAADRAFRRSVEIALAAQPDAPDAAEPLQNLGELALKGGRLKEAAQHCRHSLEIDSRTLPPDSPGLVPSLTCLAEAELGLGRIAEAGRLAERAVALQAQGAPRNRGRSLFALARTLPSCSEARAKATAARALLSDQAGRAERSLRAEIDRWLARGCGG